MDKIIDDQKLPEVSLEEEDSVNVSHSVSSGLLTSERQLR